MDESGPARTTAGGAAAKSSQQVARERDRLKLLLDVNNAVASHLALDDLLHAISESLRSVVPHDSSTIGLYDTETNELKARVLEFHGELPYFIRGGAIPLEGTTGGEAFTTGQPVFVNDADFERFNSDYFRKGYDAGFRSGGNIPLIAHGRKLGVLGIASFRENDFSEDDIQLLCQVANQIAIAVENSLNYEKARNAERELARRLDQLNLLLDVTNNVASQLDLRKLFSAISHCLRRVIKCDAIGVTIPDPESGMLRIYALEPHEPLTARFEEGELVPTEDTPAGQAIKSLQTVIVTRAFLENSPSSFVRRVAANGIKSGCVAPLISHGRALGTLGVLSVQENAFTKDDADLITQIASQVAIAVENALNFERARQAEQQMARERERLELLLDINNKIASSLDLRDLFKTISACLRTVIHHDYADLGFYDEETDRMRLFAVDKPDGIQFGREDVWGPVEGTPPGLAIHSRQTVLRNRPDFDEFPSESFRHAVDEGIRSGCTVPLISRDRVLGVLTVASRRESAFADEDGELMTEIGVQVAIAVDNALNFEAVRSAEKQIAHDRDRFRLLLEVNNAVVSHLDLHELLKAISASLRGVIHHDFTGLALYDPESNQLRAHALENPVGLDLPPEGDLFSLEGSPSGLAFTSGQPVYMSRPDPDRFPGEYLRRFIDRGLKSLGAVPLIAHGKSLGVLGVMCLREDSLREDDIELLAQIAKQVAIGVENALTYGEISRIKNKLAEEKLYLEEEINSAYDFEQIIGSSPALRRILKQVETVAPTDSTVLIQGETGTGKELIARAIHSLSTRRERTLVKLNCAAIPTGLLESELFGHERGAFTGAIAQRIGRFELAHKGTLFLDEVGEIALELQPKLLRVLQEQEFERLGSTKTLRVDIRLIAATNRNLSHMVADRQFRDDLYYRLNVFPITIPPLRERQEDIPLLARFFASRSARRMKKRIDTISAETLASLKAYEWPGNIRELENLMERAVILTQGNELKVSFADMKLHAKVAASGGSQAVGIDQREPERISGESGSLETIERAHILRVLDETDWVVSGPNGAAARLGLKRTTLQARMKKLGIKR